MKYCIISPLVEKQAQLKLQSLGYHLIFTRPISGFSQSVAYHADLQFFDDGEGKLYSLDGAPLPFSSPELTRVVLPPYLHGYEAEAKLNLLRVGKYIFGNSRLCADIIMPKNVKFIHVNQGYTGCSSIPVGKNALITDDPGIHCAAQKVGIHSLLCQKGDVRLSGYPYGFIGGASIRFPDGSIGFFGDLDRHRDAQSIRKFLREHNTPFFSLCSGELTDCGGGVIIERN